MVFVPIVPPPAAPSPRAQELGQRFRLTIAEFEQKYPDLSPEEIRQALELASREGSTDRGPAARAGVAVAAAAVVAAGLGVYLFARAGHVPAVGGAAAVIAALLVVGLAVAVRSRRE